MEFEKYMHVERLGKEDVEGITSGTCYVFPKIDGTNGQIYMDNGELHFGSRKRELSITSDNAGFMNSLKDDNRYAEYFKKFPKRRLYGEWLVPHTIKGYSKNAWRKFYVFDVESEGKLLAYNEYIEELKEFEIDYVPVQAILENPTDEQLKEQMEANEFLMDTGIGEGIVVKNYEFHNKYGNQVWGKMISAEFKVKHKLPSNSDVVPIEFTFVEQLCTEAFVQKEFAKICIDEPWEQKKIPMLISKIFHELINEELWDFLKKHKNPTINFRVLQGAVVDKIKLSLPQVF